MKLTKRELSLKEQAFSRSAPLRHLVKVRKQRAANRLERDLLRNDNDFGVRLVRHMPSR